MSDVGAAVDAGSVSGQTGQGSVSPAPDAGVAGSDAGGVGTAPVSDPTPAAPAAGQQPADWRSGLSEELRASPALTDVNDVGSLAKQFIDLQAHMGNSLRIPGPDAGADDRSAFHSKLLEKVPGLMPKPDPSDTEALTAVYQALGRPETAEQYQRPEVQGEVDDGLYSEFTQWSHDLGHNQQQHAALMGKFVEYQNVVQGQVQEQAEGRWAETRTEWGHAHGEKMQAIHGTFEKLGAPPALLEAITNGHVNFPMAQFFDNIVKMGGGATAEMGAQDGGAKGVMTPAEAEIQIMEIQRNPDYHHHDLAVRQPLMDKMGKLVALANPSLLTGQDAMADLKRSSSGSS